MSQLQHDITFFFFPNRKKNVSQFCKKKRDNRMIPSTIEQKHKMKSILPYLVIICPYGKMGLLLCHLIFVRRNTFPVLFSYNQISALIGFVSFQTWGNLQETYNHPNKSHFLDRCVRSQTNFCSLHPHTTHSFPLQKY